MKFETRVFCSNIFFTLTKKQVGNNIKTLIQNCFFLQANNTSNLETNLPTSTHGLEKCFSMRRRSRRVLVPFDSTDFPALVFQQTRRMLGGTCLASLGCSRCESILIFTLRSPFSASNIPAFHFPMSFCVGSVTSYCRAFVIGN